ncbi:MAG: hypothetical protein GX552_11805 [Chloroflexi bacterium]|jgi:hypothetical protein|nr:hypothetical protein [Chloroflexota bacterium]
MLRQRWFVRPYGGFIGAWLHYGKPILSALWGLTKRSDPVDLGAPFVFTKIRQLNPQTLRELADWLAEHTEWVSDPLWGLWDAFPTAGHIEWQLNHGDGVFRDDCDGLAYLSALAVRPFCDSVPDNYIVTVVYDPTEVPVQGSAHVLNVFRHQGEWRVFSNATLDMRAWDTPCAALYDNSYYHAWCEGARLLQVEVRNAELELLATGLWPSSRLFNCDLGLGT